MYEIETEFLQEVSDILCDRINLPRVKIVVRGRMERIRGRCLYKTNTVEINAKIASCADVDDTLRHEVAHMYAYVVFGEVGHGNAWKHACTITGAKPNATHKLQTAEDYARAFRWRYVCSRGCVHYAYRVKPRFEHGICARHREKFFRQKVEKPVDNQVVVV